MKVKNHYDNPADFALMLEAAERKVSGSREEDFVAGLKENFGKYGPGTFLSDLQSRWLCDIAARG